MNLQYRKPIRTILDGLDNGLFDTEQVLIACLKYMSDDEVVDMMRVNEFTGDGE